MALFVCDLCNHVDAVEIAYPSDTLLPIPPAKIWRCTKCQIGEWHDFFEYAEFQPSFDIVVNRPSGLGLETMV